MTEPKPVFVHLIVYDQKGPIKTSTSSFRVACRPESSMPTAASPVAMKKVITCPLCLKSADFLELCVDDVHGNAADAAAHEYAKGQ